MRRAWEHGWCQCPGCASCTRPGRRDGSCADGAHSPDDNRRCDACRREAEALARLR